MDDSFRLRYVNQLTGVFILFVIVGLLLFTLYLVRVKELFATRLPYQVVMPQKELDGLREGTEVYILGKSVGHVSEIEYQPGSNDVRMTLMIKEESRDKIFTDSELTMRRKFGVGEPYLEILRGEASQRVLQHDDPETPARFSRFVPDEDKLNMLAEKITNIEEALLPMINSARITSRNANKQMNEVMVPTLNQFRESTVSIEGSVNKMERKANKTMTRFEQSAETLDDSVARMKKSVVTLEGDTKSTLASIRRTSNNTSRQVDEIEANVEATLKKISDASDKAGNAADDARDLIQVLKEEADDLPGTVNRFNNTLSNAQETIDGINRHWLLRRYVDQEERSQRLSPSGVR
jgi:ABC-type transporter Mla subunit MlaD